MQRRAISLRQPNFLCWPRVTSDTEVKRIIMLLWFRNKPATDRKDTSTHLVRHVYREASGDDDESFVIVWRCRMSATDFWTRRRTTWDDANVKVTVKVVERQSHRTHWYESLIVIHTLPSDSPQHTSIVDVRDILPLCYYYIDLMRYALRSARCRFLTVEALLPIQPPSALNCFLSLLIIIISPASRCSLGRCPSSVSLT